MKRSFSVFGIIILLACGLAVFFYLKERIEDKELKKIIERLSADSRVAEVVVTDVQYDPKTRKNFTTIKFLEYDAKLNPLPAKYFTFSGNTIQFQALVIRFDDFLVKKGHPLKGKSAYLFMKAFMLTDGGAEVFPITKIDEVPQGYKVAKAKNSFEERLWKRFWEYALSPQKASGVGVKNAQIEAPGTRFIPGMIYTLKIEHDGGLRIDAKPIKRQF